jgi:outer membrane protein OmpA-like peptidoglycan-associated protein
VNAGLFAVATAVMLLTACSSDPATERNLQAARDNFLKVREDQASLAAAPKDVIRAGETLERAERLAGYWGSSADADHYADLSQRYSEIAMQKGELAHNQQRAEQLQLQVQNLQLTLRESRLLTLQQQSEWVEEQMLSLSTMETERGLVLTLGDVLFSGGSAELSPAANRTLIKLVQFLQLNPRRVIRVEGYTDSVGDAAQNLDLSRKRAQSVADALVDLGVDVRRIRVSGYGEAHPVADNASVRGRAKNRRVEIVFSDAEGNVGDER